MCVKPKNTIMCNIPKVYLNGQPLPAVSEYKYVEVLMLNTSRDDADISRQLHSLYARSNSLISNF